MSSVSPHQNSGASSSMSQGQVLVRPLRGARLLKQRFHEWINTFLAGLSSHSYGTGLATTRGIVMQA